MRKHVRMTDPFPRHVRSKEERQLWVDAIRCSRCKCEYCVWGHYLKTLYQLRVAENAKRLRLGGKKE